MYFIIFSLQITKFPSKQFLILPFFWPEQVSHNTVLLWQVQVGVAVRVHSEGTLQLLLCMVSLIGAAAVYPSTCSSHIGTVFQETYVARGIWLCRYRALGSCRRSHKKRDNQFLCARIKSGINTFCDNDKTINTCWQGQRYYLLPGIGGGGTDTFLTTV